MVHNGISPRLRLARLEIALKFETTDARLLRPHVSGEGVDNAVTLHRTGGTTGFPRSLKVGGGCGPADEPYVAKQRQKPPVPGCSTTRAFIPM
jgi:hypothetical protein